MKRPPGTRSRLVAPLDNAQAIKLPHTLVASSDGTKEGTTAVVLVPTVEELKGELADIARRAKKGGPRTQGVVAEIMARIEPKAPDPAEVETPAHGVLSPPPAPSVEELLAQLADRVRVLEETVACHEADLRRREQKARATSRRIQMRRKVGP